jgi:hypothetical protein
MGLRSQVVKGTAPGDIHRSLDDFRNWRFCSNPPTIPVAPTMTSEALRTSGWNGHHDNGRSSIQSTYNRRSEKSQTPSIFTNVSW